MKTILYNLILLTFPLIIIGRTEKANKHQIIINEEFIYKVADAKTPQCHASTIAESGDVLVAAWFGGTQEKNKDVGIWISRKINSTWSIPFEVVNGIQKDGTRFPCWNPVLFQPKSGKLFLFYKVGPNPRQWWGMYVTSKNNGKSWSEPIMLPNGIYGPIKNKPIELSNGDILSPTSTEHDGWKVQVERSSDLGQTWKSSGDLNDTSKYHAIQPTILVHSNATLQMLCRTKNSFISELWSYDNGYTWSLMVTTGLPNPNSGIDAVSLKDGRYLLVYNPTDKNWGNRVPLSVAISDDGIIWKEILELESVTNPDTVEEEEYSYPSVIQTKDGLVHIVYTWNRKTVKHVVINPKNIK